MGNANCFPESLRVVKETVEEEVTAEEVAKAIEYEFPDNLYEEIIASADMAQQIYYLGWLFALARNSGDGISGLTVSEEDKSIDPKTLDPVALQKILADNEEALVAANADLYKHYKTILDRLVAASAHKSGALTVMQFGEAWQSQEVVYTICKNDVAKRITLCFRGTEQSDPVRSTWNAALSMGQKALALPEALDGKVAGVDKVWVHSGYGEYLFAEGEETTKYDSILENLQKVVKQNPGYTVAVTGHSAGGALASIAAFFLATDATVPKPVTLVTFAAPRAGDGNFVKAYQQLETDKLVRAVRVINYDDMVAHGNLVNYSHVGYEVKLLADGVSVSYPETENTVGNLFARVISNPTTFGMDPDRLYERLEKSKAELEKMELEKMYTTETPPPEVVA